MSTPWGAPACVVPRSLYVLIPAELSASHYMDGSQLQTHLGALRLASSEAPVCMGAGGDPNRACWGRACSGSHGQPPRPPAVAPAELLSFRLTPRGPGGCSVPSPLPWSLHVHPPIALGLLFRRLGGHGVPLWLL